MSSEITVALIVGGTAAGGPLLLGFLNNRARRQERKEDWARQDAIAARVKQVRDSLSEATTETTGKLDEIHLLVNSRLDQALKEIADLKTRLPIDDPEAIH